MDAKTRTTKNTTTNVKRPRSTSLVIGAGSVGAPYAKRVAHKSVDVLATVLNLDEECEVFERRINFYESEADMISKKIDRAFMGSEPFRKEITLDGRPAVCYQIGNASITLTAADILKDGLAPLLRLVSCLPPQDNQSRILDHVVNAVNLGTIFGLQALEGGASDKEVYEFLAKYNRELTEYSNQHGILLPHLLVSTTGTGGIGLERLCISHNREESGVPDSILQKSLKAGGIRNILQDFNRSQQSGVVHKVIVPASAIVDLTIYRGRVRAYGDYTLLDKDLLDEGYLALFHPGVVINGKVTSQARKMGSLSAVHGLFGEDGPHTAADLQQLELFMGVTTAPKIAEIIEGTITGQSPYNYDVLHGGMEIPEQSEYAVLGFENRAAAVQDGKYSPISLSPIAPFEITVRSFAYELLGLCGLPFLKDYRHCPLDDGTMQNLAGRIIEMLQGRKDMLMAATSLGVKFDLQSAEHFEARSPIVRGTLDNETLRECIVSARDFLALRENSPKLQDVLAPYETAGGIPTASVIGYLAAYPFASQMRKQRHF